MGFEKKIHRKGLVGTVSQYLFTLLSSRASSSVVVVCCKSFCLPTIEVSALSELHGILRSVVLQRCHEFHYD